MPDNAAAIWAAVAASFAALSSFLIMLIQRRNLLESVRPELVLTGWSRTTQGEGDAAHEVITFQSIKNVGRGAALTVIPYVHELLDRPPFILTTNPVLHILAPNETCDVNGSITVWWKNVQADKLAFKCLPISLRIFCWDSRDIRHEIRYNLLVHEISANIIRSNEVAPGITPRRDHRTITRPTWLIRLRMRLGRIPGLGRLFREVW
jgi:hypothetical protein